jgi:hypothetical protein
MLLLSLWGAGAVAGSAEDMTSYAIAPVPFTAVHVQDDFWLPRLETNRKVTIPYCFRRCEETGRIDNFAKAGGLMPGEFVGIYYNDSDVFKVIEGAAYALALQPDPALDKYLDDLIVKIAAAQEADGYLYTARTLNPDHPPQASGSTRWSNEAASHELYNIGHLYEAAVAHYEATGKRSLLDVALKSANLIVKEFGPDARHDPPGHQEIEIGLAKLYRLTQERRYLDLARFFLEQRGRPEGHKLYGDYSQDHLPVTEQDQPVGHAVRAGYMYCGMADVAALSGDPAYVQAIDRIWENMVAKRLYLTGGIGARAAGEAFGDEYELPNATAYCETCAAIANAMWNYRMFLLHGDAKYIDVLERVLYNGFLSGVGLSGDRFFYPNPLASYGGVQRQPWFDCACCPTNVARFLPSMPGYVYATRGDALYVNLFVGGEGRISLPSGRVRVVQKTRYPWEGRVELRIAPERAAEFDVLIRVPGWLGDRPVPSDLYRYTTTVADKITVRVNHEAVDGKVEQGYLALRRAWQPDDEIEIELPLPIRRVVAHPAVADDVGRVALERGPLVYCVEGVDHGQHAHNLWLPDDAALSADYQRDLLGGVTVLRGRGNALRRMTDSAPAGSTPAELMAIPHFAWAHRDAGEMAVWLARTPEAARPLPRPTPATAAKASASHVHDTLRALHDQLDPQSSGDHAIPRFTWWDHRGTTEWVQYDFDKPLGITRVEVYWFDDTGVGQCRTPESWRLLSRTGDTWRPVRPFAEYGVKPDQFNVLTFEAVETTGLRIEVQLKDGYSGGILEWRVE